MRAAVLATFGTFTLLTGCAPVSDSGMSDAPSRSRQCFSISQVDNFRQGDPDQLFLRVARNEVFELDVVGGCQDLGFAHRLALVPDGRLAGSRLCTDDWARIIVPDLTAQTSVCRARVTRKLTDEEIAALPPGHRP